MRFITDMKIRTKLSVAFGIMVILMAGTGVAGYQGINRIHVLLDRLFSVQLPAIDLLNEADRDLQQLLVAERSMMFTDPASPLFEQFIKQYKTNFEQSGTRWEKYKALSKTDQEKAIFAIFDTARKEWEEDSLKVVEMVKEEENQTAAVALSLGHAKKHFEEMREQLDRLTEINLELAAQASAEGKAVYDSALTIVISVVVSGIFLGGFWPGLLQGRSRPR